MAQAVRRSWSGAPLSSAWWMPPWTTRARTARARLPWSGEPGIGKTRMLAELEARAAARGPARALGESPPSSRASCRSGSSWTRSTSTSRRSSRAASTRSDQQTLAELAHVLPSLSARTAAAPAAATTATAPIAPSAGSSESLAASKPLVLRSGRPPLGGLRVDRAARRAAAPPASPRRCCSRWRVRPRQLPERLSAALERAHRGRRPDPPRARTPCPRRRPASCSARASTRPRRPRSTRRPAATPSTSQQLARAPRAPETAPAAGGVSMAGVEVPRAVAAALTEELALLSDPTRRVLEGAAVAGDPFEPELAAAAAGIPEPAAIDALDELLHARPRARHRRAAPLPLPPPARPRAPSTRPLPAAGGSARTSAAAEALAARGAPAAARAHHVEYCRPATATSSPSRSCAKPGEAAAARTPATAARWFAGGAAAAARRPRLLTSGSRCSSALPGRRSPPGDFARAPLSRCSRACELLPERARPAMRVRAHRRVRLDREPARAPPARPMRGSRPRSSELPDPSSPQAAALILELGDRRLLPPGATTRCADWAQRALDGRRAARRRSLHARAAAAATRSPRWSPEVSAEAERELRRSARRRDRRDDRRRARRPRPASVNNLAAPRCYLDRLA